MEPNPVQASDSLPLLPRAAEKRPLLNRHVEGLPLLTPSAEEPLEFPADKAARLKGKGVDERNRAMQAEFSSTNAKQSTKVIAQTEPRALEICAGSGGLSFALWKQGLNATGVDWQNNRHASRIPLLTRDLTDPDQQAEVKKLNKKSDYTHMAPPCGTASRARDIKISKVDKAKGAPEAIPLRNEANPWGIPDLSSHNQMKVDKANAIYLFCISIIEWCCSATPLIPFTLENPSSSWIWIYRQ